MRKPHVPQNRNVGGTSLPHDGQRFMPVAAGGAKPGEKPGTPGGGPIGAGIAGPGPPSGPAGGIPIGPAGGMPPGIPVWRPIGGATGCGIAAEGPRSGAPAFGACPGSAIIVFIIPMSGLGAAVSSAPHPRQNL
jgi:hypothetical protein